MNYLCKRTVLLKPVLLAGALGVGLLPAIGHATPNRGDAFNIDCQTNLFNGSNCSLCHSGSPSASNANPPACPTPTPTPTPIPTTPDPISTPTPAPTCTDADGDNYAAEGGNCGQMDCNDADIKIHPGATEICTDRIDNNCNDLIDAVDRNAAGCPVADCTNTDGDDYAVEGGKCGPVDCDDGKSSVNPGKIEICDDGFDNNCDGNADAVDATCQAMNDGDDEALEDRHDEAKRNHHDDRGHRHNDDDDEDEVRRNRRDDRGHQGHDDDEDEGRDSRRRGRESRDHD